MLLNECSVKKGYTEIDIYNLHNWIFQIIRSTFFEISQFCTLLISWILSYDLSKGGNNNKDEKILLTLKEAANYFGMD